MKRRIGQVVRRAMRVFLVHDVFAMAAALAFYTLLSFAPLVVIVLWTISTFGWATNDVVLGEIATVAGNDARVVAQAIIDSVQNHKPIGIGAQLFGVAVVIYGSTLVFAQLQSTLNLIWDIPPRSTNAVWGWMRRRIVSAGVLLAIAFVMTVSTLLSTGLGLVLTQTGLAWQVFNKIFITAIFSGLFAVLFRYLPDARLHWRHAWGGGAMAALMFVIGKWVIGVCLASENIGGVYGPAGSVVVLLVWTYYSAIVFFFSAELLEAWVIEGGQTLIFVPRQGLTRARAGDPESGHVASGAIGPDTLVSDTPNRETGPA